MPTGRLRTWSAHPRNRSLNALRFEGPPPADVAALPDVPCVELAGVHARPPDGWDAEVIAHLCFAGHPPAADPRVAEIDRAALVGLRRQWLDDELPRVADLIVAGDERVFAATPTRGFAVTQDGAPVAMALLMDRGPVQMVEDVYTAPSHRGLGLASALVRVAVRAALEAGAELVHLPTAADGPARRLYERLGFVVCAHTTQWVR